MATAMLTILEHTEFQGGRMSKSGANLVILIMAKNFEADEKFKPEFIRLEFSIQSKDFEADEDRDHGVYKW
jgi:hypothetical protein